MNKVHKYFNREYQKKGINAQRLYPNELVSRSMSFFKSNTYKNKFAIDFGSGLGSNFQPLLDNNFQIEAIELSGKAISISKKRYKKYENKIKYKKCDFFDYKSYNKVDLFLDIFSSYTFDNICGELFISNVSSFLKKNGLFVSVFPSKNSDTWRSNNQKSNLLDVNTLKKIRDKKSPYFGNNYNFRFLTKYTYTKLLEKHGLNIISFEKNLRTYHNEKKFELLNVIAKKR